MSEATLAQRPTDSSLQIDTATDACIRGMALDQTGRGSEAVTPYQRALARLEPLRAQDGGNARVAVVLGETARHYAANRLVAGDRLVQEQPCLLPAALDGPLRPRRTPAPATMP